jgi:hypothetical protein
MPVTLSNDEKKISLARNEIRRQYYFHTAYNPQLDEPSQRQLIQKIYVPNSVEPDFKDRPEVEPSLNHYLLSQRELKGKKLPTITRVH